MATASDPAGRIAILYRSAFRGDVARLAERIARGVARVPGASALLVTVKDVDQHRDALHRADAIIMGSPTYVGSVSAGFKAFIESLAGDVWLGRMWLGQLAAGFTCSAGRGGDKFNRLLDLVAAAAQMGMEWVPLRRLGGNYSTAGSEADLDRMAGCLGVMAQANIGEPGDRAPPKSDLMTAGLHGEHMASTARQLAIGRAASPAPHVEPVPVTPGRPRSIRDMNG